MRTELWYRTEQFIGQVRCVKCFGINDLAEVDVIQYSEKQVACKSYIGEFIILQQCPNQKQTCGCWSYPLPNYNARTWGRL